MNQPHGGPHGSNFDQEQQYNEQQHRLHQMRQQEDLARHEREHNDRQERERQERERQLREQHQPTPPHQNNTGSIPIHQPVASRLPGAIHSPGGLLANHGGAPPAGPLGAPSGPGNAFGGPLHNDRQVQHNQQNAATQQQQHQMFGPNLLNHNTPGNAGLGVPGGPGGFGGALQQQEAAARLQQIPFAGPMTGNSAHQGIPGTALGGQQPILNDALSYLDQVKVQFADQPEVYNKFLDIMKDFKSQSIDTPGVINRVSDLFAGHPNLIQGFNTFLPPGYRIECGTGTDPNTIRVTTPMGTTVQSIPGRAMQQEAGMGQGSASNGYYGAQRPANWQQMPHHSIESPETVFSPQNQNSGPSYAQNQAQQSSYEAQQAAAAAHQREQRGVSQLTNAVAAVGQPPRNTQTPTPGEQAGMNGAQPGMEKRGPVEFNHAISYVNKIKNRFQSQPEIYKQFLEILQTYQRESKPIQDVYRQVTTLFNTAPDLLEDFKQFLPESAAAAKQAQAQKAAEEAATLAAASQTPQGGRSEAKMPPVGTFTASGAKENKKRPRNNPSAIAGSQIGVVTESNVRGGTMGPGAANKRAKLNHNRPLASDAPAVSPTLTPIVPEPLQPHPNSGASSEELAFFDRVKKYIANKQHMNEFLKLCNIFSQDLIDRNVLVQKAGVFIGGNPELMNWFKAFVNYDGRDEVIDNRVKVPTGRVALSNCRGFGPSYRLLPKREREKPCSGRDEMCKSVLNDDWASHPTWASEDSGFVSHRKNIFEESLHRIEEERHDYDFNIEANAKVIQLLEPIAQNIVSMDPAERESFRMPMGLAGQSPAIYRRVLKKIYGERGTEVTLDLFKDPSAVLPVVLARLKQKDEEWRFTQREWEKVWHAQTQAMYLKSLDHMGIHVKQADKKNFAAKHLVDVIKTKHEEQRRQRNIKGGSMKPQFSHEFNDKEVILDVVRIMILYASTASQHNNSEKRRIIQFFERFVSTFFDIPQSEVDERTADIDRGFGDDEEENPPELSNGRGRRPFNGKKNDLRRGVLDKPRNGARGRSHQDGSASGSRESTPDVNSIVDETMGEAADDQAINEVTNDRWTTLPLEATASEGTEPLNRELKSDEPQEREFYSLYCNQTIYVFFTIFHQLYRRLHELKNAEEDVVKEVKNSKMNKAAKEIGLLVETNDYFGDDNTSTYYTKTLLLVEDFITSDIDSTKYEDFLRHYYLKKGWQLYSVADLLKTLCKLGATCNSQDQKEKTPDLMEQFYKNRELRETTMTYDTEINLRKQAAKYIKDGELFHIKWFPTQMEATVQWVHKDDTTFDMNDMDRKQQWQYYISSYVRVEPTEGVNRQHMHPSLLRRNLAADTDSEDLPLAKPLRCVEDLVLRVCVNSYKLIYKNHTQDWAFFANNLISKEKGGDYKERHKASLANKRERFEEKFVMNNAWMKNMDQDQVQKMKQDFTNWIKPEGVDPAAAASSEMEQ